MKHVALVALAVMALPAHADINELDNQEAQSAGYTTPDTSSSVATASHDQRETKITLTAHNADMLTSNNVIYSAVSTSSIDVFSVEPDTAMFGEARIDWITSGNQKLFLFHKNYDQKETDASAGNILVPGYNLVGPAFWSGPDPADVDYNVSSELTISGIGAITEIALSDRVSLDIETALVMLDYKKSASVRMDEQTANDILTNTIRHKADGVGLSIGATSRTRISPDLSLDINVAMASIPGSSDSSFTSRAFDSGSGSYVQATLDRSGDEAFIIQRLGASLVYGGFYPQLEVFLGSEITEISGLPASLTPQGTGDAIADEKVTAMRFGLAYSF